MSRNTPRGKLRPSLTEEVSSPCFAAVRCNSQPKTSPSSRLRNVTSQSSDFEVDYGSEKNASIVHAALAVDKELQPDKVKREMSLCEGRLLVHFEATEARFLRASFSAFVDAVVVLERDRERERERMGVMEKLKMFVVQEPVVTASCLIAGVGNIPFSDNQPSNP
ncbi:hypothetical protein ACLOJK_010313 [Asimina triloba]